MLDRADNTLLLLRRSRFEILLQIPFTIRAEAELRVLCRQVHRLVQYPALNRRYLRLVIGIPHVQMNVRDKKECPLFLRLQLLCKVPCPAVQFYGQLGRSLRLEFRDVERQALFPKIRPGTKWMAVVLTG